MTGNSRDSTIETRSRGVILVQFTLLLVVLLGLTALAIDTGMIATARVQLKTVADAAALAGARQLASQRRISTTIANLTIEVNEATAQAIAVGNANSVLGKKAQLTSSDIVVGYKDVSSPSPDDPPDTSGSSTRYNSVQVTANATVAALFSRVFGSNGSNLSVTSTATVGVVETSGFKSINNRRPKILPIVMDEVAYNLMISGMGGDSYSFNPSSTAVTAGADGVKESVTYPVKAGLSGNWGTINFGVSNNSTSTLGDQIRNGMTTAQLFKEYSDGVVTAPHSFSANPGISAGIKSDLTSMIGKSTAVPIYDASGGNGDNAYYHVVKFATVRIVAVNLAGSNKYVVVQPAISDDATAIPDTDNPSSTISPSSWSNGGAVFLRLTR